ncbi:hypothetical protein N7448_011319 [Penicillium atrosanguineum]|nr:hypothetical protein N7448_011319 [Penicillium atrosanguineum]
MNGYPVILRPEGASRIIAFGTTGIVCQSCRHPEQVIKAPLRYKVEGCSTDVIETTLHEENFARLCFEREKIIYKMLPEDPNVLNCIEVMDHCIRLPFLRLGNLRDYLLNHNREVDSHTREKWITMAASAIGLVHSFGVIHADISARNFLVADDMSIKLCDFSGSAIGEKTSLISEEDRYRMAPNYPRSTATDIFALGCLMFEITTGRRPYDEISDEDCQEIERFYSIGQFPSLEGLPYQGIIQKCWTCQYNVVDQVKHDLQKRKGVDRLPLPTFLSDSVTGATISRLFSFATSTLAVLTVSGILLWWYPRRGYWRP